MQLNKAAADKPSRAIPRLADVKGATEKTEYPTHVIFITRPCTQFPWHKLSEELQNEWTKQSSWYASQVPQCWATINDLPDDSFPLEQRHYLEHAYLSMPKNRHGPTPDHIPVRFHPEYQRFMGRTDELYSNVPGKRQPDLSKF
jgi:hypothetical protein